MRNVMIARSAAAAAMLCGSVLFVAPALAQEMTYFDAVQTVHKTCVDGVVVGSTAKDGAAVWECKPANAMAVASTCMFVGEPEAASRDKGTLSCKQ